MCTTSFLTKRRSARTSTRGSVNAQLWVQLSWRFMKRAPTACGAGAKPSSHLRRAKVCLLLWSPSLCHERADSKSCVDQLVKNSASGFPVDVLLCCFGSCLNRQYLNQTLPICVAKTPQSPASFSNPLGTLSGLYWAFETYIGQVLRHEIASSKACGLSWALALPKRNPEVSERV